MSSEERAFAIAADELSKKFKLFATPQHRILEALHPFGKKYHQDFWALKKVSFRIERGRTYGIIGRNGSGKSTLLQVIAGILRPTTGRLQVTGRVAALLELGSGFNPEFTGRQNVLMQGALMGLSQEEMLRRLPSIQAFADIGAFLDQPVRVYSSGMFVRLAFASAIHVDPDILIVDEALAVGDAKFQEKCYRKFIEFQRAGKTIVLVTHDLDAVAKHCDHVIVLDEGDVVYSGPPQEAVHRYIDLLEARQMTRPKAASAASEPRAAPADLLKDFLEDAPEQDRCPARRSYNPNEYRQRDPENRCELLDYLIACDGEYDPAVVQSGARVELYLKARYRASISAPLFGITLKTVDGVVVYALNSYFQGKILNRAQAGDVIVFKFELSLPLQAGDFFVDVGLDRASGESYDCLERRITLIHLQILREAEFHGLVDLGATCEEIRRIGGDVIAGRQVA